ncbi:MAG: pilus assembly protein [Actinomycetia bacterium]|nr:pilus assembly protein [Actinomycetes bacterium]
MNDDDNGAAMVEFIVLAVTLAVPLCYLVISVFDVQRTAFGASAATREAARVFVRASSTAEGEQRAAAAVAVTLADHGITFEPGALTISCSDTPCLTPGATVVFTYRTTVDLPFVPQLGSADLTSVPITASHTQTVDEYTAIRP